MSDLPNSYAFWNNKGGTGKTSLCFQTVCAYAQENYGKKVLVIDVCPQANLSELFLGGLEGGGSQNLLAVQGGQARSTVGGYFESRLPKPYDSGTIDTASYISRPADYNQHIPENIYLMAGDPLLELQSNAMSTLANASIPGTNTWLKIVSWLRDFVLQLEGEYDTIFFDSNPSFSIYTQIALASAQKIVLPVMADDSSRRAVQNAISLIYGLKLPSDIYEKHLFATRMEEGELPLPRAHLIVKNRLTQYVVPASSYRAVLDNIEADILGLLKSQPEIFTFSDKESGFVDVRDFQTAGVVAFAMGTPFARLRPGKRTVGSRRVTVNREQKEQCEQAVLRIVDRL